MSTRNYSAAIHFSGESDLYYEEKLIKLDLNFHHTLYSNYPH